MRGPEEEGEMSEYIEFCRSDLIFSYLAMKVSISEFVIVVAVISRLKLAGLVTSTSCSY